MINYRVHTKDTQNRTVFIASVEVTNTGAMTLAVPNDVPPGGLIVIEWESQEGKK
jgi:hypothetical protein